MSDKSYPIIEFCGNCKIGAMLGRDEPGYCDYYSPSVKTSKRCVSWKPAHFLHCERVVYICSPCHPLSAGEAGEAELGENLLRAEAYSYAAVISHAVPIAPHLLFTRFLDEFNPSHRNNGLELAQEVLKRCDELWVFGDRISEGMKAEIEAAEKARMPIIRISQEQADEIVVCYKGGD